MTSVDVREFSLNLRNYIDNNKLPHEVKRYVLADLYNSECRLAEQEIEQQLKEREKVNE